MGRHTACRCEEEERWLCYGLTGGIGAGKSTVCQFLQQEGVPVVSADEVSRQVVAKGSDGLVAIVAAFGPEILDSTDALNRRKLGALVFNDAAKRRELENIMQPLLKHHSRAMFADLARKGEVIIVYESALLFESQRHFEMQGIIVVTASEAQRVACVQQRDGCTEAEGRARMRAHMHEAEKRRRADYILDNNGDVEDLRRQVRALVSTLRQAVETGQAQR
jgi:dephospho-CoA kinase